MTLKAREVTIFDERTFSRVIARMAHEIIEKNHDIRKLVLIGIKRGGSYLKERIKAEIEEKEGVEIPTGDIDITLYRDDIFRIGYHPKIETTEIPINLTDRNVVLIDDVLYTGRTARAAIDALFDFGRPKKIQFAVMVDRGHRELPIQADFVGKHVPTAGREIVNVMFSEHDGRDGVIIRDKHAK